MRLPDFQTAALIDFNRSAQFRNVGRLSVALVVTQHARERGLPLDPAKLLTEQGGQVLGLSGGAAQAVLNRHGISRVLSKEGGRTSRGSIATMQRYVGFLNQVAAQGPVDLDAVERFWVDRVLDFFAGKPFQIRLDAVSS